PSSALLSYSATRELIPRDGVTPPLRRPHRARAGRVTPESLLAPAPLLPQSHLLGELRARGRVVRRHHRIVRLQCPFLPVLLGSHVVLRAQMALQGLELLAVLKANDVVRRDRFLDRHSRLQWLGLHITVPRLKTPQLRMNLIDQSRHFGCRNRIVADISRDDFCRQFDEIAACHVFALPARGRAAPSSSKPNPEPTTTGQGQAAFRAFRRLLLAS